MTNGLFIHRLFIATAALTGFTVCLSEMTLGSPFCEAEVESVEVEPECKSTPADEHSPVSTPFIVASSMIVRGGTLTVPQTERQPTPARPLQHGTDVSRGPPVA